jgi:hypothetical protein
MSKPIRQQSSAIAACLRDSPPNSKRDAGEPPRHHSGVAQGKPLCNFTTGRLEHTRHQVMPVRHTCPCHSSKFAPRNWRWYSISSL